MIGVLIGGPCHVKANNLLVVRNNSQPESDLEKADKSNSIVFDCVQTRASARAISVPCKPTDTNLVDMLIKIQLGYKRLEFAGRVLFNFDHLSFWVSFWV